MLTRARAPVAWIALAVLAVLIATWPAVLHPDRPLEPLHLPDVQGGLYWPWAFARSLVAGEALYLRPELLWPEGQDLRLILSDPTFADRPPRAVELDPVEGMTLHLVSAPVALPEGSLLTACLDVEVASL